jgi:tetratricopeptide (TPR) repeat protein
MRKLDEFNHEPPNKKTLKSLTLLGILYKDHLRFKKAEKVYSWVAEVSARWLGADGYAGLVAIFHLGEVYTSQGRLSEAEAVSRMALDKLERTRADSPLTALWALICFGNLLVQIDRLGEAESTFSKALTDCKALLEGNLPNSTIVQDIKMSTIWGLARVYSKQGRVKEAESLYLRALEMPSHTDRTVIPVILEELGSLYTRQSRLEEAEQIYLQLLEDLEKSLGPNHPFYWETVVHLGWVYESQNRLDEAEAAYERALAGFKKVASRHCLDGDFKDATQAMQMQAALERVRAAKLKGSTISPDFYSDTDV